MLLSLPLLLDEWEWCDDMACPLLFREPGCSGPLDCPQAQAAMEGVSIFMLIDDDEQYVATMSKTRH